jgi:translocator protein
MIPAMHDVLDTRPHQSLGRQLVALAGWLVLAFAAAAIGAVASINAGSFYGELARPGWAPPAWLFAPVWSVLYFLMGVAAWLLWRVNGFRTHRSALVLFIAQLAANALWTWIFFTWHQGAVACVEILLLWGLIVATLVSFGRRNALAGLLLVPYLAWVTFAAALTFSVWRLNPGTL